MLRFALLFLAHFCFPTPPFLCCSCHCFASDCFAVSFLAMLCFSLCYVPLLCFDLLRFPFPGHAFLGLALVYRPGTALPLLPLLCFALPQTALLAFVCFLALSFLVMLCFSWCYFPLLSFDFSGLASVCFIRPFFPLFSFALLCFALLCLSFFILYSFFYLFFFFPRSLHDLVSFWTYVMCLYRPCFAFPGPGCHCFSLCR